MKKKNQEVVDLGKEIGPAVANVGELKKKLES